MNIADKELIMAFHDGETSAQEASRVKALLERDPEAARFLSGLARADACFSHEMEKLLDQPVPEHLVHTAGGEASNVVSLSSRTDRPAWAGQPQLAVAASMVAALMIGMTAYLQPWQQDSRQDSPLAATLHKALETAPSGERVSDPSGHWVVMPTATYRSGGQGLCRQYAGLEGDTPFYGVSCRDQANGRWSTLARLTDTGAHNPDDEKTYIPASAADGDVTTYLSDAVLIDMAEEQDLLRQQWQ